MVDSTSPISPVDEIYRVLNNTIQDARYEIREIREDRSEWSRENIPSYLDRAERISREVSVWRISMENFLVNYPNYFANNIKDENSFVCAVQEIEDEVPELIRLLNSYRNGYYGNRYRC